jgi:uncharacterized protein
MTGQLPRTTLGRTGLEVTCLGIGGAYCPTVEGYQAALACGVDYIDTARSYRDGADEEVIGRAIRGRRHELVIATKTVQRTASAARVELESSLRALGTDYVDVYQLHHLNTPPERDQALGPGGALEAVRQARAEGLVRYIGVTGHDWVQVQQAVDTGRFDTVLCWYNSGMKEPEATVFPAARRHGAGVVIMSAGRNDRLFAPPDAPAAAQFYRYALTHPAVDVVLLGLRNLALFSQVAAAVSERTCLGVEEMQGLEAYAAPLRAAGKLD